MSTTFDESFLINMPTSFKYDPSPPTPPKDDNGNTLYSSSAFTTNYTLRKYKKPRQLKLRSIGSPAKSSFAFPIIGTDGKKTTYSSLPQSSASLTDATKDNLINTQIKPGFNACNADPNCWGIGIQNPTDPVTGFNGTYTFNYYSKPDPLNTPSANTDPVELLDCDFTNTFYTFIKNTSSSINPNGPTACTPPPAATVAATPTDAPTARYTCPPDIANMPTSTPHYYVCLKQQTPPPVVSIWKKPTTWIIISVVVLLVGGVGYYFWKKRQSESESIDYSKFLKKNKGGYYFLT